MTYRTAHRNCPSPFGNVTLSSHRESVAARVQAGLFRVPKKPWNAGRIIGPKAPLKPKHISAIRQQLKASGRRRDLAMLNCAIDAKSGSVHPITHSRHLELSASESQ